MQNLKTILSSMALCVTAQGALAQDGFFNGNDKVYQQSSQPSLLRNFGNSTYYVSKTGVSNILQGKLNGTKNISDLVIDPQGKSYAVVKSKKKINFSDISLNNLKGGKLLAKNKDKKVQIFDLWDVGTLIDEVKVKKSAVATCYSGNGMYLLVADGKSRLNAFNANNKYKQMWKIDIPFQPDNMVSSSDGKYVAMSKGQNLIVINLDSKNTVESLVLDGDINDMEYTADSKELAVLCNGTLRMYDAQSYRENKQISSLGDARAFSLHPTGSFASVINSANSIMVVNLESSSERFFVDVPEGNIADVLFEKTSKGDVFLVYNSGNNITYKQVETQKASLGKMVADEVNMLMEKWEMKLDNETAQQYAMRVNPTTRAEQMRLFEEQVATRMAGDYANTNTLEFSRYNPVTHMMQLDFDNMSSIYLPVESSEINAFMSPDDVELRNPVYTVKNDNYELVYADVYNKQTGKTYTFDNRDRKSLDNLAKDKGFMPMAYAQQNSTNAMKLDEIKQDVVSAAKKAKSISDHTNISVNTEMTRRGDGDDQAIDYKVGFGYSVDAAFSGKEDFPSGRYNFKQSKAGQAMLAIIKEALNSNFAQYIKEGKKVTVKIVGSADASAIKKTIPYAGEYGDIIDAPVTKNNEQTTITVTKKQGIKTNDQLAYLRATGMRNELIKSVPSLKTMDVTYETIIEQAEGIGGEFRRIFVDFIFEDAFAK